MKKYEELVKDNAFTEDGKKLIENFEKALCDLLLKSEFKVMTISQLRTVGGLFAKMIGDAISNKIQTKSDLTKKFQDMSDQQFENYLKNKYGDNWMFVSLSFDEFARIRPIPEKDTKEALEKGMKDRDAALANTSMINLNQKYKIG